MAVWSIVKKSELEGALRLDAEYYQPKFFRNRRQLEESGNLHSLGSIAKYVTNGATPYHEDLTIGEVRFLTAEHVYDLFIDYSNSKFIKREFHNEELRRTALRNGDLLVTIKGKVGNAAVVFNLNGDTNINQDVARLILKENWNPFYVAAFINSYFGKPQSSQLSTNQINPFLGLGNLKQLLVPSCSEEFAKKVEQIVRNSQQQFNLSESLYLQAEEMLLKELGLDRLRLTQPKWWTVRLSQAREFHRLDAEHFQPRYDKLIRHLIKTTKTKLLGEIASYNKRGLQPTYVENGEIIVVNSQHLGRYLLNIEATERTDESFWETNSRSRLKRGDILFYSTGAYIGRTNVYLEDHKAVASNHVNIIRTKDNTNSIYLSVFLNWLPGLLQAEKWASGSGQREVYPADIARFVVPILPQSFQEKIADLVIKSHEARQKAKALLEEAKQKVEAMIEGRN